MPGRASPVGSSRHRRVRTNVQVVTSPSLSGVWAAVAAGLGITVRTRAGLPATVKVLKGLPCLPAVGLNLHHAEARPSPAVRRLEELLLSQLEAIALRRAPAVAKR